MNLTLASLVFGPLEFEQPQWLVLLAILVPLSLWIARKSLSGLDSGWKYVAIGVRLIVLLLLCGAIAEPLWRKESKAVAVTAILDVSESIPTSEQKKVTEYFRNLNPDSKERQDELGVITTARDAFVGKLPSANVTTVESGHPGTLDATDLAAGLRLAIAVAPKDAANRFLLITDGNQTSGDLLAAANSAKALKIPVDVLPIRFEYGGEVLVDQLLAPAAAREGETMNVKIVLVSNEPTRGRVNLLLNGQTVDLDSDSDALGAAVELRRGQNVLQVPVTAMRSGPQRFEAIFQPEVIGGVAQGDSLPQNNRSAAVTFVAGEGRVLVIRNEKAPQESEQLIAALEESKIAVDVVDPAMSPPNLTDMQAYDAVILVNQSAYAFSQQQQEDLRQYVNDTGGGLVMIGGPESFGAGGWIGSPLEEALPVRLDPPQKRQMPKGALVICVHSVEMPEGVYWGKKVSEAAVNRLSRLDLAGINEYTWQSGHRWVHPLGPVGDGTAIKRAINALTFGDMQDFTPSFQLSLNSLKEAEAGQRHMIVISDGDPSMPPASLLQQFKDSGITVSTVEVFPHSGADSSRMEEIARLTGGRHYFVNTQAGLAKLPEIFMKEAMTVRRSLIWESGKGVVPSLLPGASTTLRGVSSVPVINGYVVTAEREGLALTTAKVIGADPDQGDPLLAQWQYGLGRVVAYTSDASTKWNASWVAWQGYRQFWEQHVRWTMRPQGSANIRVLTENKGDNTLVTIEALDSKGERLSFANFRGRLAKPDGTGVSVEFTQTAPGRYQATVATELAGSYVLSTRYAASDSNVAGGILEGAVQAAISRPFADEYRVLRDNTALLTQIAELTGGRVLSGDPQRDGLWERTALEMPVAKTPIWLTVAIIGLILFVLDVGVRRVRLDLQMVLNVFRRAFGKTTVTTGNVGGLRAAREQARAKIQARATTSGTQLSADELARQAKDEAQRVVSTAGRKFEASTEQLKSAAGPIAMGGADAKPQKIEEKARPVDQSQQPGEGMSRLMQAKKKARDGMGDE
jgi:uncharacterized membrane protein